MDDIKKLIRSLLISSSLQMDIFKLDRDYYEEIGEHIPYQKFGYGSLEEFLRSMPDVLEVQGHGKSAELRVIADQKTAHIDRLVSLQRPPQIKKPRFGSRPRRRQRAVALCDSTQGPSISKTLPDKSKSSHTYTPPPRFKSPLLPTPLLSVCRPILPSPMSLLGHHPLLLPPPLPLLPLLSNNHLRHSGPAPLPNSSYYTGAIPKKQNQNSHNKSLTVLQSNNAVKKDKEEVSSAKSPNLCSRRINSGWWKDSIKSTVISTSDTSPTKNQFVEYDDLHFMNSKKESRDYARNITPDPNISSEDVYFSDYEDHLSEEEVENIEGVVEPTQIDDNVNYNVPLRIQENLKMFISKYPNGIWCRDVPKLYKKMFRYPLDYEQYGYRSLPQMCLDLESIFYCYRPANADFLLYDNTKPLSKDFKTKLELQYSRTKTRKGGDGNLKVIEPSSTEPALVGAEEFAKDIAPQSLPECVMGYGEKIPRQFLPEEDFKEDFIDVTIGEVYDPSKFWINLTKFEKALNVVMDEMQYFYCAPDTNLKIPPNAVKEGLYCACKYSSEYHRAIIVKLNRDKKTVKVFYIDYGTLSTINITGVHFLHKKFSDLPAQAIRARLASIWPTVVFTPWSSDASSWFLKLVQNKELVAHIHKINEEKKILEIFLADTTTDEDIYMNDELVKAGYALFTNQEQQSRELHPRKVPKYTYIHLYPNFDDLENGNAPSATEIVRLSKAGVQDEYMYPNCYQDITNDEDDSIFKNFIEHKHENWSSLIEQESVISEKTVEDIQEAALNTLSSHSPLSPFSVPSALSNEGSSPRNTLKSEQSTYNTTLNRTVKPPPGFENFPPNYYFTNTTINVNNVDNTSQIKNANPLLVPRNMLVQQMPQIPNQTVPIMPQSQPLVNPVLLYPQQFQQLINNCQTSQSYLGNFNQNLLINQQQNPLFINQNPLIQQTGMCNNQSNLWNNQVFNESLLNTNIVHQQASDIHTARQFLKNIVCRRLAEKDLSLIDCIDNMLKEQSNRPENKEINILFKIIYEIIKNASLTATQKELVVVINNFVNLLDDDQLLYLVSKQVTTSNHSSAVHSNTSTDPVKETIEALTKLDIKSEEKNDDLQTDTDAIPEKSLVLKTDLGNRPVHVVQYEDSLYVPVDDVLQFTSPKPTLDVIRSTVMLLDPLNSIKNIDTSKNKALGEELLRFGVCNQTLPAVPLKLVPAIIKIHCGETNVIKDFRSFLNKINS